MQDQGYWNSKGEWVPSVKGKGYDESGAVAVTRPVNAGEMAKKAKEGVNRKPGEPETPIARDIRLKREAEERKKRELQAKALEKK